jgi:hypothetical protein
MKSTRSKPVCDLALEPIYELTEKELDAVCGGANPHPIGEHRVTGKDFQGSPNAGAPGVWGDPEGHPVFD